MIQAPVKPFGSNLISHFCKLENMDSNDITFWQNNQKMMPCLNPNPTETGWKWQNKFVSFIIVHHIS
jgi:hypothetical protein